VIDEYFSWTSSRRRRHRTDVIAQEVLARHQAPFPERPLGALRTAGGGQYQWRAEGEYHLFNPRPSTACRRRYARAATRPSVVLGARQRAVDEPVHLARPARVQGRHPVPLEEVEPVERSCAFKTGAMSYGSISKEAHETLAIAMNRIGGKSNTGEGGEDPSASYRCRTATRGIPRSAGGLGPLRRDERVPREREGAADQDGAGRQARRGRPAAWHQGVPVGGEDPPHHRGRGLISPPPHHDIYSIEDLAELIHDLRTRTATRV